MRLYGSTKDDKFDLLLLEYFDAGDLASHLSDRDKRAKLSSMTRVNILCEVGRALNFLHNGGVIDEEKQKYKMCHRDIKSSNICLDSNYCAKLIDCGLTKFDAVMGVNHQITMAQTYLNTSATHVMGTSGYMCPCYSRGIIPYQAACDVYSFGVVMFEMLTGQTQNAQMDLTLKYKTVQSLTRQVDPLAGPGWNHVIDELTHLAAECVVFEVSERPTCKEICSRLSLIQMHMTKFIQSQPDAFEGTRESDESDGRLLTCGICSNTCSNNHAIICINGHVMDSSCCLPKLINFCGKARVTDWFRCPFCPERIGIDMLVHKVPFEYIMLLQKRYDDIDNLLRLHRELEGTKVEILALKNRVDNVEDQQDAQDSRLSTLEVDMKEINNQVLCLWKCLSHVVNKDCPCPQYIIVEPTEDRKNAKTWFIEKVKVYFVCEYSWERGHAFDKVMPKKWVVQVSPWVSLSLQVVIKTVSGGIDAGSLVSFVADKIASLVEQRFPEYNNELTKIFLKGRNSSQKEMFDQAGKSEGVSKVLKEAYSVLAEEAEKHSNWKHNFVSIPTADGNKWVMRKYEQEARTRWVTSV